MSRRHSMQSGWGNKNKKVICLNRITDRVSPDNAIIHLISSYSVEYAHEGSSAAAVAPSSPDSRFLQ